MIAKDSPVLSAWEGETATFEGRVTSIQKSETSGSVSVELTHEGLKQVANCEATELNQAEWKSIEQLTIQSLVRVTGEKFASNELTSNGAKIPRSNGGAVIHATNVKVIAKAKGDLPHFLGGELSGELQHRLDNRVLDQRAAANGAIFKLFSGMNQLIAEFFTANEFHWLHTPRLRSSHVAGDNEYFHVPYFGRDSWLVQHSQHSLQGAIAMDMKRVWDIAPVFRQEAKSDVSARHMSEFTLLGANMTYENDWHEVVDLLGEMLVFVFRGLQERKQFAALLKTVQKFYPSSRPFRVGLDEKGRIPRITFPEAKRMLREELGFTDTDDNENFTPEEEAALGRYFRESPHLGETDLFTIEHFPLHMRQFNSKTVPGAPHLSETWDFIAGGREICSGSHRVSDYDELCQAMLSGATGPPMDPESPQWRGWTSTFKVGMAPHAGASFGVNRMLQGFLGLGEIREVTLFPRDANRLAP